MPSPQRLDKTTAPLTASLLTPPGRGAVAVIRVHASGSLDSNQASETVGSGFVAVNGKRLAEQPVGRLCYGHWVSGNSSEDVVVCRTDESSVEISCHGGRAAVNRILDTLTAAGALVVDWNTQQATISSPFETELADAVSQATTTRTAAFLLEQSSGTLSHALNQLLKTDPVELKSRLAELLSYAKFGLHLTQPWRVVLAGRPNVGKSTLINALLGYTRAVVFDQPGTTRDVVTGQTAFDGWPIQLADTAGIRITDDELEQAGISRGRRMVDSADLICLLLDTSQPPSVEDQNLLAEFAGSSKPGKTREIPAIFVAHKSDLPNQWSSALPANTIPVSSTTGSGIDNLIAQIVRTLIPKIPSKQSAVPISQRQIDWLKTAHQTATNGDSDKAFTFIQNCLSGVPCCEITQNDLTDSTHEI